MEIVLGFVLVLLALMVIGAIVFAVKSGNEQRNYEKAKREERKALAKARERQEIAEMTKEIQKRRIIAQRSQNPRDMTDEEFIDSMYAEPSVRRPRHNTVLKDATAQRRDDGDVVMGALVGMMADNLINSLSSPSGQESGSSDWSGGGGDSSGDGASSSWDSGSSDSGGGSFD